MQQICHYRRHVGLNNVFFIRRFNMTVLYRRLNQLQQLHSLYAIKQAPQYKKTTNKTT